MDFGDLSIGAIDQIKSWRNFILDGNEYDLSHLDAHWVNYNFGDRKYRVIVSYSCHCFTKEQDHHSECEKYRLMYHAPKESRPFHLERYELSKTLKRYIERLDQPEYAKSVGYVGYENYASIQVLHSDGSKSNYKIVFKVYRDCKKLRLHVTSAYKQEGFERVNKVNFEVILKNVLTGKSPPKPRGIR